MSAIAPEKPRRGAPCNGCGLCCAAEVCDIGVNAGLGSVAPCPAMRFDGERFRCQIVEIEAAHPIYGVPGFVAWQLGIGKGCDAEDEIGGDE